MFGIQQSKPPHLFHKLCAVEEASSIISLTHNTIIADEDLKNEAVGTILCPHCGTGGEFDEVSLEIQGSQPPVFFPDKPEFRR